MLGEVTFGDLGFEGCMRLAQAYRSLPRPSSAIEPSYSPNSVGTIPSGKGHLYTVSLNMNLRAQKFSAYALNF